MKDQQVNCIIMLSSAAVHWCNFCRNEFETEEDLQFHILHMDENGCGEGDDRPLIQREINNIDNEDIFTGVASPVHSPAQLQIF